MSRAFPLTVLFFLVIFAFWALSGLTQSARASEWTILVYVNADNDLEEFGIDDINEMEMAGSSNNVNIVAQVDRISWLQFFLFYRDYCHYTEEEATNLANACDDSSNGNWADTRRYYIVHDTSTQINSIRIDTPPDTLGELNMGNPQTLANFVNWGIDHYPATHYAVIIWNHGDGWYKRLAEKPPYGQDSLFRATSFDYTNNDNIGVSNGEWQSALSQIKSHLNRKIDLVGFDACMMQMWEVLDITNGYADYVVGSEEIEPGTGWYYPQFLNRLVSNPTMSPRDLGKEIVDACVDSGLLSTQSCIDMAQIPSLTNAVDTFAYELLIAVQDTTNRRIIDTIRQILELMNHDFYFRTHIDLYDFAYYVEDDTRLPSSLNSVAYNVMLAVNSAVSYRRTSPDYIWAKGVAIYYPEDTLHYNKKYNDLPIAATTLWDNFIRVGFMHGDANGDGKITTADVTYLINYLMKGGPPPFPLLAGDANCDGRVTIADAVYLINYLYKGGPPPPC